AAGVTLGPNANTVSLRGIAIYGFSTANVEVAQNTNDVVIERNVLGSTATSFTDPGAGASAGGANIRFASGGSNNAVIRSNLVGFAGGAGLDVRGGGLPQG